MGTCPQLQEILTPGQPKMLKLMDLLSTHVGQSRGGKNGSEERNELGEQHWSPVSSAFFFLIRNDAVLDLQLSLEHCMKSQACISGFQS